AAGLGAVSHVIGTLNDADEIRVWRNAQSVFGAKRVDLQRAWSETSYRIAALRDDAASAREEFDALLDTKNPGLSAHLTFDPNARVAIKRRALPVAENSDFTAQERAELSAALGAAVDVSGARAPAVGGVRPRVAILREQGVNGQVEMAAAFD